LKLANSDAGAPEYPNGLTDSRAVSPTLAVQSDASLKIAASSSSLSMTMPIHGQKNFVDSEPGSSGEVSRVSMQTLNPA
jgi:hypothetical protein